MFIGTVWYRERSLKGNNWVIHATFRGPDKQKIAADVETRAKPLRDRYEVQGLVSHEHFEVVPPEQKVELVPYKGE